MGGIAKPLVQQDECKVCGEPRNGKGSKEKQLCARCSLRAWRKVHPSAAPKKREQGSWTNLQVHIDSRVDAAFRRAARKARQTLGAWIESAIRAKLGSDEEGKSQP